MECTQELSKYLTDELIELDTQDLTLHDVVETYGFVEDVFKHLVERIGIEGQLVPIIIDGRNRIIDGRHRWCACKQLQIKIKCQKLRYKTPTKVIKNMAISYGERRNLSRAMKVASALYYQQRENVSARNAATKFHVAGWELSAIREIHEYDPNMVLALSKGAQVSYTDKYGTGKKTTQVKILQQYIREKAEEFKDMASKKISYYSPSAAKALKKIRIELFDETITSNERIKLIKDLERECKKETEIINTTDDGDMPK